MPHAAMPAMIWTIGHSTRKLDEFLGLLVKFRIEALADVRSFPGSRQNIRSTARNALCGDLKGTRDRIHLAARTRRPSGELYLIHLTQSGENAAFRGYADHMGTAEFAQGLEQLLKVGERSTHGDHVCGGALVALPIAR